MIRNLNFVRNVKALFSHLRTQGFFCDAQIFVFVLVAFVGQPRETVWARQNPSSSTEVVTESRDSGICFVVNNLEKPGTATIKVWVDGANVQTDPPILGSKSIEQGKLIFTPRFPLQTGTKFIVEVGEQDVAKPGLFLLEVPGAEAAKSKVVAVYPSADELPENTLKFYVHFSAPMRKGNIYRYVRIREAEGKIVELPFLEIEQEFWSRDSKRLTLLLDPGRIKRGLKPREEMGPILTAGKSFELVIDGRWPDSRGEKLGEDFVKKFRATHEDHTQPDPSKWKISSPASGTRQPLAIGFAGSIDHAMLLGAIRVIDPDANIAEGEVAVSNHETRWSFVPKAEWTAGSFKITINQDLEDNAGNSIGRQFDVDMFEKTESGESKPVVELEFEVAK